MNKRERFMAAISGDPVDYVPATAWIHFGTDWMGGAEHARRHAAFYKRFDWDIVKIVNDFRYPGPAGVETLNGPAEMARWLHLPMSEPTFAEELITIRLLREEFGPDVPIMLTTFDPYQQVMRRVGYTKAPVVYAHPDEALAMLEKVCATMCDYMRAAREVGCDTIFFSINGAITPPHKRGVDDATFRQFMRDNDIRMLEAMQGMVRVLHVHGNPVDVTRVLDYPCEAISVSDRLKGNPSLAELRSLTDKCIMGGIDESSVIEKSLPELRAQINDAFAQAGRRKFILSPGCTIPTQTPWNLLDAIRAAR